jgi:hypothetical protein
LITDPAKQKLIVTYNGTVIRFLGDEIDVDNKIVFLPYESDNLQIIKQTSNSRLIRGKLILKFVIYEEFIIINSNANFRT